ncbi:ABC transporter permease [Oscillatoria sp. FACHB-1407]|nr:FtsX-like permease family protein [Oscillatoria sp. FACHB-1407]MBD2462719.1 ABC transporter permease [Oscillatoria sp. FACHB-1407]
MASIARKNLFEDIPRFLVAQAGIMFAVSLVTIQTGILSGFSRSTTSVIDNSQADIWVAASEMVYLELTLPLPAGMVAQAQEVDGVVRAEALSIRGATWRSDNGEISPVRLIGFSPNGQLFIPGELVSGNWSDLQEPYSFILDESNLDSLDLGQLGEEASIGSLPARLIGLTQETQSIASSPFLFTSLESANAYVTSGLTSTTSCRLVSGNLQCTNVYQRSQSSTPPARPAPLTASDTITYVLVQAASGQDLELLKQRLEEALPGTRAYTKAEISSQTRDYWQQRTGLGFVLGLGATVGVIVGMVIVGQILYSSVSDHLKEFGTLKAMGASDWLIYRVIIEQALWMAVLGYAPSMGLCLALGAWTFATQGIMILITPVTAAGVLGITVIMCVGSALFAIQKVTHVDPAIVFKV